MVASIYWVRYFYHGYKTDKENKIWNEERNKRMNSIDDCFQLVGVKSRKDGEHVECYAPCVPTYVEVKDGVVQNVTLISGGGGAGGNFGATAGCVGAGGTGVVGVAGTSGDSGPTGPCGTSGRTVHYVDVGKMSRKEAEELLDKIHPPKKRILR